MTNSKDSKLDLPRANSETSRPAAGDAFFEEKLRDQLGKEIVLKEKLDNLNRIAIADFGPRIKAVAQAINQRNLDLKKVNIPPSILLFPIPDPKGSSDGLTMKVWSIDKTDEYAPLYNLMGGLFALPCAGELNTEDKKLLAEGGSLDDRQLNSYIDRVNLAMALMAYSEDLVNLDPPITDPRMEGYKEHPIKHVDFMRAGNTIASSAFISPMPDKDGQKQYEKYRIPGFPEIIIDEKYFFELKTFLRTYMENKAREKMGLLKRGDSMNSLPAVVPPASVHTRQHLAKVIPLFKKDK